MHRMTRLSAAATLLALAATAQAECTVSTIKSLWGFSYDAIDFAGNRTCAGVGFMTFTPATKLGSDSVKISLQGESCNGTAVVTGSASGAHSVSSTCAAKSTNLVYAPSLKTVKI